MAKTYYETLGVPQTAKAEEIKAAYRRLVLKHHPDKSVDPSAPQIFRGITEAFEALSDSDERKRYDDRLASEAARKREAAERQSREEAARRARVKEASRAATAQSTARGGTATAPRVKPSAAEVSEMTKRLSGLFARQRFAECEMLARQIIQIDPRRALPYAVLGDIARGRGGLEDAARMYSLALQMEPTNAVYLRNYDDVLDRSQSTIDSRSRVKVLPQEKRVFAILSVMAITLLGCIYIILSPEKPALEQVGPVSTWTIGVVVMLFLSGASAGAALSISNLIDRIDSFSSGRISPTVMLGAVALFSFPLSLVIYGAIGLAQKAYTITSTRLMLTVTAVTACLALGASLSPANISLVQTLLWGGNLVYLGAVGGWTIADSMRR